MSSVVETTSLSKSFGSLTALSNCSLSIPRGTTFGLLGPNGAGKSTLLRVLVGFLRPTSGRAIIDGFDCWEDRIAVHQRTSYLPGDARLFRLMRGINVLKFFSEIRRDSDLDKAKGVAERLELDLSRRVGFMSTGMRQKLALAVCLAIDCPLLILDEPTANLDPSVRGEVLNLIGEAKQSGKTVVFSSHVLSEIEEVCDQVGILRKGELVHIQSISELKKQHRIVAKLNGELPPIPTELKDNLTIRRESKNVLIESPGELSTVLGWLSDAPLSDVYVRPIGLRSVYDRFHHAPARVSETVNVNE